MNPLQRHPLAMAARFRDVIVLTYAFPQEALAPLVPPSMALDTHGEHGFVAVALVDMAGLRPAATPRWFGSDAVFVGYRVFVRTELADGRQRRGLKVLRTDVDRPHLLAGTRILTRYDAGLVTASWTRDGDRQRVTVRARWRGEPLGLEIASTAPAIPPPGSPFASWEDARPFSGPLPWTLAPVGADRAIAVKGVRSEWRPEPVEVIEHQVGFFDRSPFRAHDPVLASAFHVRGLDYRWEAGRDVEVHAPATTTP